MNKYNIGQIVYRIFYCLKDISIIEGKIISIKLSDDNDIYYTIGETERGGIRWESGPIHEEEFFESKISVIQNIEKQLDKIKGRIWIKN